jgi:hypothetical protein
MNRPGPISAQAAQLYREQGHAHARSRARAMATLQIKPCKFE